MNKRILLAGLLIGFGALFSSEKAQAQCSFTPSYTQDFSTYTPTCWTEASGRLKAATTLTGTTSDWGAGGFLNVGSSGSARMNIYTTTKDEWLISPTIILDTASYQLEFTAGLTDFSGSGTDLMGADDTLAVVISTDDGATWSTSNIVKLYVAGSQPSNTGENVVINLSGYIGNIKVGFYAASTVSNTDYNVYIDNFAVNPLASCAAPSGLMTSTVTLNSASFNWTENGTATAWEIEYGTTGFTLGSGTKSIVSSDSVNVTGLMSNMTHDVYVRAICGTADTSNRVGPISFYTGYCLVSTSFTGDYLSSVTTLGANTNLTYTATSNPSGSYADETAQTLTTFASGTFDILTSYVGGGNGVNVWVDWNNDLDFNDTNELIGSLANSSASKTISAMVPATVAAGNYRMRVRGQFGASANPPSCGNVSYGTTVDFTVAIIAPPSCFPPSAFASAAITSNSADLFWTENNTATSWEIEYDSTGFTFGTGTRSVVASDSTTVSGLMSQSTYQAYVRAICGPGDTSAWNGPISFTTLCSPFVAPFTEDFASFVPDCWDEAGAGDPNTGVTGIGSGNWGATSYLNASANGDGVKINLYSDFNEEWILSPTLDLTTGGPLELVIDAGLTSWNGTTAASMGSDDEVLVLISEDNMMSWDTIYTWNASNEPPVTGNSYRINLAGYSTNNNIVAIWATDGSVDNTADYDFHIGAFELRSVPACLAPSALATSLISNDSLSFGWTENNTATEWQISYGVSGFTAGSGIQTLTTTNPDTLVGLGFSNNTTYDFYIRSICGVSDTSGWSSVSSVTTPCGVEIAPFIYGFEDLPTITGLDGVYDCWTATRENTSNDWNVDASGSTPSGGTGPTGPFGGTKYIYLEATGGIAGDEASLITPPVDVSGLTLPMIEFYYHMFGDNRGGMGNLYIDVIDGGVTTTIDSIINEQQSADSDPWLRRQLFLPTSGDTIQVVIRASRGSLTQWGDISVDEFSIKEAPTCPDPTFLSSFNITATTTDVTWQDNASAASWLVEWDTAGYAMGSARNSMVSTNDTMSLINLIPFTNYDWTVRAICSSTDSSAIATGSFNTPATCPRPSSLTANGVFSFSADISWTEIGTATAWDLEYDTVGFTPGTGTRITASIQSSTITNLMASSDYEIYVRSICSATDSSFWSGPLAITTGCPPSILGYTEDFSSYLPNCWTEATGQLTANTVFTSTSTSQWAQDGFLNNGTTGAARLNIWSTGRFEWLISPTIDLGTGSTPIQIEFDAGLTDFTGSGIDVMGPDDTLSIVISTDNGVTWSSSNVLKLYDVNSPPSNLGERVELDLSAYSGLIKIGFYGTSTISNTDYNVYIDSFVVAAKPIPYYAVGEINKVDTNGVADSLNVTCFTSGTVAGVDLDGNNGISFTIIDQSTSTPEGISIFNFVDVSNYVVNEGDSIMVRGFVDQFNGLTQIRVDSIMLISTGSALPPHTLVTALDETTESQLIRMENLTVTNVPTGTSINIDLFDGTNTFTMRVDADTDVLDSLTFNVGDRICSVNGIGGQFDGSNPFTSGYQIFPMRYTDVVFAPSVDLGPDTIVCDTTGFMLDAGMFASYMWNTGDTTQMITPNDTVSQYIVTVMDANGCTGTDTVDVTVTVCVGINEVAQNNAIISFFPNPNNGQFKLEVKNVNTALSSTIEVVSINGQVVYTENLNINGSLSKDINLNVEKGLYFVRLINENGVKVEKLIIK